MEGCRQAAFYELLSKKTQLIFLRTLLLFFITALLFVSQQSVNAQERPINTIKKELANFKNNSADTTQIELMLELVIGYVLKPGELKEDMDSARTFLAEAKKHTKILNYNRGRVKALLYTAVLLRESGDRKNGKSCIDSVLLLAKQYNYFDLLGHAFNETTHYASDLGFNSLKDVGEFKAENYEAALSAFQNSNNIKEQAFAFKNLSDVYGYHFYDYVKAIRYAYEAIKLYQSINYPNLQGVYDILNINYNIIGDYTSAIKYGLLAVKAAEVTGDSTLQLCTVYNRLGMSYYSSMTDYETTLLWFKKSYQVAKRHKDLPSLSIVGGNVARSYVQVGKSKEGLAFLDAMKKEFPQIMDDPVNAFRIDITYFGLLSKMKDFHRAKIYYEKLVAIEDWNLRRHANEAILQYLLLTKQISKAEALLADYDSERFKKVITFDGKITRLKFQYKVDSLKGDYKKALKAYQRSTFMKDSALNAKKLRILEALRVEHEIESKNADIQNKADSIRRLQEEALLNDQLMSQAMTIRNGTVIGIILVIIVLAITYTQYRAKKKSNVQLVQQQELLNYKNSSLNALVSEKEWLLKEIHHRVKNNLQTIVSLLESQSRYIQNSEALSAIIDSQNRVNAMSIIHQKLFQTQSLAEISVQSYLPELIQYLRDSFETKFIRFVTNIAPLDLDVTQAVPIGLIINEAITNSIKYAFPVYKDGQQISIFLTVDHENQVILIIKDNGTGLPDNFDINSDDCGLGIKLMKGLTRDIDGEFAMISDNGLKIEISFTAIAPLSRGVVA